TAKASFAATATASRAPSIRSWSVMARWVMPRAAAARTTDAGEAIESKLAEVWQWRSTKARAVPDASMAKGTAAGSGLDRLDQRLLEEVVVLERLARA